MSIDLAENLKRKLTDKWVIVDPQVPELKRFAKLNGKVMTVNMNGRALVKFDGPADIGWYDIDPAFLTVIDAPRPKAAPAPKAEAKPATAASTPASAAAPSTTPAAKPAGKSPLDMIRAQQAAKSGAAASAPAGEKKLSPMEIMRQQQAAKAAAKAPEAQAAPATETAASPVAPPPAAKPAIPTTGPDGKPLSKLDMIRMQGGMKKKE